MTSPLQHQHRQASALQGAYNARARLRKAQRYVGRRAERVSAPPSVGPVGDWWAANVAVVKQPGRRYGPAPAAGGTPTRRLVPAAGRSLVYIAYRAQTGRATLTPRQRRRHDHWYRARKGAAT